MKRIMMIIAGIVFGFTLPFVCVWVLMYPNANDPKNIKYILWKIGIYKMDLDMASATMVHDAYPEKLVVGKTKGELRAKFGYLLNLEEASEYLRNKYKNSDWNNEDVLFIRKSPWMIVFKNDKAVNLVLVKG